MIKCLLTEFSGAGRENIWLKVMKQGPYCARFIGHDPEPNIFPAGPTTQLISSQYFDFVGQTFITHDLIKHRK